MRPARIIASASFSGGGASNRSEYDAMSSSEIPANGSAGSDPVSNADSGAGSDGPTSVGSGVGSGVGGSEATVGVGSGAGSGSEAGSGVGSGGVTGSETRAGSGVIESGRPCLIHSRMRPARIIASASFSGGGASNRSEYDAMSSSDSPANGSAGSGSVDNSGLMSGSSGSVMVGFGADSGPSCLGVGAGSGADGSGGCCKFGGGYRFRLIGCAQIHIINRAKNSFKESFLVKWFEIRVLLPHPHVHDRR